MVVLKKTKKRKKTRQKFTDLSKFNKDNTKCKITKKRNSKHVKKKINKCNKILLKKENDCNCFLDKKKLKPIRHVDYKKNCKKALNPKCKDYNECRDYFAQFMNGSEPDYTPEDWTDPHLEGTHNCYAYFLDDKISAITNKCKRICSGDKCRDDDDCNNMKPQPGYYSIKKKHDCVDYLEENDALEDYSCKSLVQKVMCDNSENDKNLIELSSFDEKCPNDYYKGIVVSDSGQKRDMPLGHTYHFYRQDSSGRFSHKPGTLPVENLDAYNDPIYVPHLSAKNYTEDDPKDPDGINYDQNCSYMCVPRNYKDKTNAI